MNGEPIPLQTARLLAVIIATESKIKAAKADDGALTIARRKVARLIFEQYANTIVAIVQGDMVRRGKRDDFYSQHFRRALMEKGFSETKATRLWCYSQAALKPNGDKRFAKLEDAARNGSEAVLEYLTTVAKVKTESALKRSALPERISKEQKIANRYFRRLAPEERQHLLRRIAAAVRNLPRPTVRLATKVNSAVAQKHASLGTVALSSRIANAPIALSTPSSTQALGLTLRARHEPTTAAAKRLLERMGQSLE